MTTPLRLLPILAALVLLAACAEKPETKPEPVRPVRVLTIGETTSSRSVEFAGEIRPRHEIRLAFRVGGKLVERLVDVGASVRAGQPIARLDVSDLALAAAAARAQAAGVQSERNLAQAELNRYRDLHKKNFISQAEFERRASTLEAADARLEAAQALYRQTSNQAAYSLLTAQSAGIITALELEAGQVVAAGQTVARLARRGELEAAFAVPEAQRQMVENAVKFAVTLTALPGRTWQARLRELSPAADPVTRTYAVRASLKDAGDDIELGMSARIAVSAAAGASRIEVPVAALYSRGDQPQVFLVGSDGAVRAQAVKTAGISNERVVIEAGLKPGDVVVAAGAALLRAGQRVRVLEGK